jgi:hypothetical protein
MCKRVIIEDRRSRTSDEDTPEVKRLEKELAESTDPKERKEIREELKAARFKQGSRDAAGGFQEGDRVWGNPITTGLGIGTIKGKVEQVLNGQVHVIENGTGKRYVFHPSNVHLSSRDVGGTSTVASIDKTQDTVIKAGKRTVVIHRPA